MEVFLNKAGRPYGSNKYSYIASEKIKCMEVSDQTVEIEAGKGKLLLFIDLIW
jgi:hypothetical protein